MSKEVVCFRRKADTIDAKNSVDLYAGNTPLNSFLPFIPCVVNRLTNSAPTHAQLYRGCPGGNVPHFSRMFLTLMYTDITQNTYVYPKLNGYGDNGERSLKE